MSFTDIKFLEKKLAIEVTNTEKEPHSAGKVYYKDARQVPYLKINMLCHINKLRKKNSVVILI